MTALSGSQLMMRLETLAQFSEEREMLTRTYLTPSHRAAGEQIKNWMREAGMRADFDAAGNVVGRYEALEPGRPALLIGSHYDTVRNAGKYDGMLGIVSAIACVQQLHDDNRRLPFALEIIAFADEEGVRFGATLLGSNAVAGRFDMTLLDKCDSDGIRMAQALRDCGLDPRAIPAMARKPADVLAYVELHIEQGPVLEAENLPLGIVTAIAGATRFNARIQGLAGHAGTVPMPLRRDAAVAAAEAVLAIEQRCRRDEGLVGTVGQLSVPNGATNVIPGSAEFSIDIRAADDHLRAAAIADIQHEFDAIAARRDVTFELHKTHEAPAAQCAPWLMDQLEAAVTRAGIAARRLLSGAGHDAMAFSELTDIAMLFVRCGNGGISHNPLETLSTADAEFASRVLLDFIRRFQPVREQ
jgi:hydantoinase/carbamoylase family amidase